MHGIHCNRGIYFILPVADIFNKLQPALLKNSMQALISQSSNAFVTRATSLMQKCNPSDAAGSVTTIVTNNEYFINLYQTH